MNLLIVAPEQIPVPGSGSVEICILAIARQLARNHRVTILSRAAKGLPRVSHLAGVTIVRVASGSPTAYTASVLQFIQGKSYDIIQVDNRPHCMAAIKRAHPGAKVTLYLHSLTFVPAGGKVAESLKYADLIISNSSSLRQQLKDRFPTQSQKIVTAELGVDTGRFHPAMGAERSRLRRKYRVGNRYTVLFVGRIIPRKGVPVLLKAASLAQRHVPLQLVIAGKGSVSYLKRLRAQAHRLRVPVRWIGKLKHTHVHQIYKIADCFVCPSQEHEAFGLVNVEAMASGLPVIASRIGGIPEVVKHGSHGYLVDEYRRPERFAEYMIKLGRSRELGRSLGSQGRNSVLHRFTWSQTADKLSSLYNKL